MRDSGEFKNVINIIILNSIYQELSNIALGALELKSLKSLLKKGRGMVANEIVHKQIGTDLEPLSYQMTAERETCSN